MDFPCGGGTDDFMGKELINGTVTLEMPESFRTMSAEELRKAYQSDETNRWGARDPEGHAILTVMWKDYPLLLSRLADLKTICKKNEQLSARGYAGHGYRCEGFFSAAAGGQPAEGYRFTYTAGETEQAAETVLFKRNRTVYSLTWVGRPENREADRETFAGILAGMSFGDK